MIVEEKAKQYAQSQFRDINSNFTRSDLAQSYETGYTQAVTDLSAENEKLRESLRELVEDIEDSKIYWRLANTPMYKALITPEIFDKAKQLITEP